MTTAIVPAAAFFDAEVPFDPRGNITGHFLALRDFSAAASARRPAVIEWLD
ncbi:hypothetical protein LB823_01970 [Tsukamurella sp. M9C]|uniref:hypothetical protein n=1 Tax=Tsukamurella sp. M9C TaxID=2877520 RepID=UPI001CCDC0F2|nr:hypothetical protein [Tsukamurella sp. M9C]MCA0154958.1 hypothetical protein [Tsukamurella sp. M9C]